MPFLHSCRSWAVDTTAYDDASRLTPMFDDSSRWRLSEHQVMLIVAGVHAQWLVQELRAGRTSTERHDQWIVYRTAVRAVLEPFVADGVQELSRRLITHGDVPLANELLKLVYLVVNGKLSGPRA